MSQKDTVLKILRGSPRGVSTLEGMAAYGIIRLATRVFELKKDGYNIRTVMKKDVNGKRYARYVLDKKGAAK